jgi:predicted AlkP superfamily pyrophosphatase or phosphodiesterase
LDKRELPALTRLAKGGLRADSLQQIYPTKTFATHYTIVTGLYAEGTGVVSNNMWDPERRSKFSLDNRDLVTDGYWYEGEPIWNTVEKAGKQAATYFWPGSSAQINGLRPSLWLTYNHDTPANERVEQILKWLDLPGEERPEFLNLYFSNVDIAGHLDGPDHPQVMSALQEVDRALGILIDGIEQRGLLNKMHILITSDHGMQNITLDRYIILDDLIQLDDVLLSDYGPVAHIWAKEDGLSADEIIQSLSGAHPNMRVWKKADLPSRYHFSQHKRIADVIAEADFGWTITTKSSYAAYQAEPLRGVHGWDPAWQNMHGIFIAHGPAFAPNSRLPAVRSIDIYSLMAALMQIEPADNDGSLTAFTPLLYNPTASSIRSSNWLCDNAQLTLRESDALASLAFAGQTFSLPLTNSAAGRRYEDTDILFWLQDEQAQVVIDGKTLNNCRQVTQASQ